MPVSLPDPTTITAPRPPLPGSFAVPGMLAGDAMAVAAVRQSRFRADAVAVWSAAAVAAGLDVEPSAYELAHPGRDLAIVVADGLYVTLSVTDAGLVIARLLDEDDFTSPLPEHLY
jgi:hypothetical protein